MARIVNHCQHGRKLKRFCSRLHLAHPCKERKDGAPSALIRASEIQSPGHPPRCQIQRLRIETLKSLEPTQEASLLRRFLGTWGRRDVPTSGVRVQVSLRGTVVPGSCVPASRTGGLFSLVPPGLGSVCVELTRDLLPGVLDGAPFGFARGRLFGAGDTRGDLSARLEVVPFPVLLFPTSRPGRRRIFGATLVLL
jgi:hypothetical protein